VTKQTFLFLEKKTNVSQKTAFALEFVRSCVNGTKRLLQFKPQEYEQQPAKVLIGTVSCIIVLLNFLLPLFPFVYLGNK